MGSWMMVVFNISIFENFQNKSFWAWKLQRYSFCTYWGCFAIVLCSCWLATFIVVVQSLSHCPAPCYPMNCSTPGFPVLHYLVEFAQTHVNWVGDMPSNHLILCRPLLLSPASGSFQMSCLFASGGQSIEAPASASVLPMNIQSWFPLRLTGWSPCNPRDSQESFLALQFESLNSLVFILLWGFSGGTSDKELTCQCRNRGFTLWIGNIPWRRAWCSTPVFSSGEFHRQRNLVGHSPQSHKEFMDILSFSKFQTSGPHT